MCLIAPAWFPSWQPPAAAAVAVTGGPATIAAATTLATAARLDSLRKRLAFTYALRFQTGQPTPHTAGPDRLSTCRPSVASPVLRRWVNALRSASVAALKPE